MSFLLVHIPMREVSFFMTGLTGPVNPQIKGQLSFEQYYKGNSKYTVIKLWGFLLLYRLKESSCVFIMLKNLRFLHSF